jgi:hypothetical protein
LHPPNADADTNANAVTEAVAVKIELAYFASL